MRRARVGRNESVLGEIKMKYELGDRFSIEGTEGVVRHTNAGFAWLCPAHESQEGEPFRNDYLLLGVAFAKIDEDGNLVDDGGRPASVQREGSGAV